MWQALNIKNLNILYPACLISVLLISTDQSHQCGGTFYIERDSVVSYKFQSPNYPNPYPRSVECHWFFVLAFPKPNANRPSSFINSVSLRLSFKGAFNIEYEEHCAWDSLEVKYILDLHICHDFYTTTIIILAILTNFPVCISGVQEKRTKKFN